VTEGTVLAVINCDDLKAEIDHAKAEAESARQTRIRLLRGHRDEERKAAAQKTAAAQAVLTQSQDHLKRMDTLYQKEIIARDLFEQAKRDYEVAQANYQSSHDDQDLVEADPLPEEKSRADADVAAAQENISVAMEKLQKCTIRAPISGTVLRIMTKVGESYSTLMPRPLFSLADDSIRRVRAEVDEWDVGKVKLGQRTMVSADGFPGRQFVGRVTELGHVMGRKSVLSGDPAEKVDRDILEVIIELNESAKELPIGLRVTAQFLQGIDKSGNSNHPLASKSPDKPDGGAPAQPGDVSSQQEPKIAAPFNAPVIPNGAIVVQVAAVERQSDALALAQVLQLKKFPVFVITPIADKYYRVQIGPYADAESAAIVRHELGEQGFKSFIKR
jgi:HlyD family secretion protein